MVGRLREPFQFLGVRSFAEEPASKVEAYIQSEKR